MSAILFGSISSVADTSEMQRDAFNQAFEVHGLDWTWDREQYRALLEGSGGADRIADHARSVGQTVDAAAVHETKSKIFQQSLATAELSPRPDVVGTIRTARDNGWQVGLVTTTSRANVVALLDALGPAIRAGDFDVVVDADSVDRPKPAPDAYTFALAGLAVPPGGCIAVEDNVGGVRAARAAGLTCVAFPNENTAGHSFDDARVVDRVDFADLTGEKS